MARIRRQSLKLIWMVYLGFLFLQFIDCSIKRSTHSSHNQGHGHKKHHHNQQDSDSDEDDTTASPPEIVGLKGLTSTGIAQLRASRTLPKCLGQDMRLEKLIQVTHFCEGQTGEGKNQTEANIARSLCFTACMFKYMGLIGDDLMFTSNIDSVVVDIFPPIAHHFVKKAMRSCAKQSVHANIIGSLDSLQNCDFAVLPLSKSDNCTSFGPVKGCILRNVNNICNGDY